MSDLPQELLDRIVDFLHADRAALRACALAHSSLRAPSQQHLFREFALSNTSSAADVGAFLRAEPALAAAVRVLALRNVAPDALHGALAATLPALHTLQLDARGALADGALVPRTLPGLESTRRLVLGHTDFADIAQIAMLLGALPHVSALEFVDRSRVAEPAPIRPPPPTITLTHLDLRGLFQPDVIDELARWLCAPGCQALAGLETLWTNMSLYRSPMFITPTLLLETVAPTLKELHVRQFVPAANLGETHLPPLPVLERFEMNVFRHWPNTAHNDAYAAEEAAFLRALRTRAPALVEVRLSPVNMQDSGL